ncbi:MAG: phage tail sheath subtilisin-like domain-containing protein [Caldilineaceae bacterium]
MPEYLTPGVYVEEVSSGNKPIAGVGTSTAGFVGATERGPLAPQFITSWLEFQRWYGGYVPEQSYLAYAVEGFFTNGGQRCFVARVVGAGAQNAFGSVAADSGQNKLNAIAIGPGEWGNRIEIAVVKDTNSNDDDACKFMVRYTDAKGNSTDEVWPNLTHQPSASNNLVKTVNAASRFVRVWWDDGNAPAKLKAQELPPNTDPTFAPLADGSDGSALTANDFTGSDEFITSANTPTMLQGLLGLSQGLAALELIDEVALLIAPDEIKYGADVRNAVIDQCTALKDRFAICSIPQGQSTVASLRPPSSESYAAVYYPWIKVYDPSVNDVRLIPPAGHVAGIYARTDIERGVHKAPANAVVRGALDLEFPITKQIQDLLNPRNINCIRDFRSDGNGIRVWGARTMSSDAEWRYVNVRRLFLFVEESIDEGTQWVVFEPNDEPTWDAVRRNITSFLTSVWHSGALVGTTPEEAFFVACDRTTMTQDDIDNGRLICVIGIAPIKPAEFVIFRISRKTADAG